MTTSGSQHRPDRTARLAARLRENLKRRKAQARSRRAGEPDPREGLDAAAATQEPGKAADPEDPVANPPESGDDGERA